MKRELPSRGLSLAAGLSIDADGRAMSVTATGRRIRIEVPDLATGLDLVQLGSPRGFTLSRVRYIARVLRLTGLQITFYVAGRPLAELGDGVASGLLAAIGLKQCKIHPITLLRSVFQRTPRPL